MPSFINIPAKNLISIRKIIFQFEEEANNMSTGMGNFLRKLGSGKSKSSRSFRGERTTSSSVSNEPSPSDASLSVSDKINAAKKKYALIPDRFSSLDQVLVFFLVH